MQIIGILKPLIEVSLLAIFFYYLLLFIKGTPVIPVLKVLVFLLIWFLIAQKLQLYTINWVLNKLFAILVFALIIIFQPELRRGLVHLGEKPFFGFTTLNRGRIIDEITKAVIWLSKKRIGGIIVIEREVGLKNFIETGVKLDSLVSQELFTTIFMPTTILHDGAVIITGDRVAAAGCILPLSQRIALDRSMGTRHQAAVGITEETDATVFVVSEETGIVSLAHRGKLTRDLDEAGVKKALSNIYKGEEQK